MTTNLTHREVENLKPQAAAYYVSDPITTGLAVRVAPDGKKTFSVRYRAGRQQRRLTLGAFPVITLAKARKRAEAVLASVLDGEDPAAAKAEARTADTVAELASTYIDKHAKPKKKSWNNDQRILDTEVLPHWRNRLARDITRRDVRELIEDIAERRPIFANRVRALLHKMFAFALQREIVDSNPVTGTARPGVEQQRDRVLTEDEIRQLWSATEGMVPVMSAAFRLRLLTAQRGGEVINAMG